MMNAKLIRGGRKPARLKDKFEPELIGNKFLIRSPVTCEFTNPEYYGEDLDSNNQVYHFGRLTFLLDFAIHKNKTRLFSANGIAIGYLKSKPWNLIMLRCSIHNEEFERKGCFYPEREVFKKPDSNLDFLMLVDNFIEYIYADFESQRMDFAIEYNERKSYIPEIVDDDLPF